MKGHAIILGALFLFSNPVKAQYQPEEKPFRIAMLGCIRQYNPAPALTAYEGLAPDYALWIGDNIYADTHDDPQIIRDGYQMLSQKEGFSWLMENVPYVVTWDDHDFGDNDENGNYPIKKESKEIFREFWELEDKIPADQPGVFYSEIADVDGFHIQFIMLDVRYNRDEPNPDLTGDVLGEEQWAWLEDELLQPADLRFVASGSQILLNAETGSETWENYPQAQRRLFELIKTTGAEGVIFLTGDQHYGEVARSRNALDYDAIELQFSGVNQIENPEKNIYRVSNVSSSLNSYTYIDVYPKGTETALPYLQFTIMGYESGKAEVSYRVPLSELEREFEITGFHKFGETVEVGVQHRFAHLTARYTKDGSEPVAESPSLEYPVILSETSSIKVALFDAAGNRRSKVKSALFEKLSTLHSVSVDQNRLESGLRFEYSEGNYEMMPEFEPESIKKTGIATSFIPERVADINDHYAIRFDGLVRIDNAGIYEFHTYSDDGSNLWIDDQLVVDNDGSHSARLRSGLVRLETGYHKFRVDYFEDYSGQRLEVSYNLQGSTPRELPFDLLFYQK